MVDRAMGIDMAFVIEPDGEVLAVMPGVAATVGNYDPNGHCLCYSYNGQHSVTDISYVKDKCKQASFKQYAKLRDLLVYLCYEVCVISIDRVDGDDYRDARRQS